MKFGDKLIELRKKNGYSQEELAEKLGVSRQSVSKWESNNTYPETDKIIQIANLFDCSMDDLINDKITDVESSLRKNKNIYNIWDSLLEFITKTINMFSHMKFSEGFKCIIEMLIVGFLLTLLGKFICGVSSTIIANIFSFIGPKFTSTLQGILDGIFNLIWFIVTIITVIYTFKIRYLNEYETETIKINEEKKAKGEEVEEIKKEEHKIIRKENEKPYEFLSVLSKMVIYFIKFIALCILMGVCGSTVGFTVSTVVMLYLVNVNILFLWIALFLISCTVISIQFIILIICFVFNKKFNILRNAIVFICAIILFGVSIGLSAITIKDMDYVGNDSIFNMEVKEIYLEYKDNLLIDSYHRSDNVNEEKYVIDNSIPDNQITVSKNIASEYFKLEQIEKTIDNMPVIKVQEETFGGFRKFYDLYTEGLKNNKIYTFEDYGNDPITIKANETTINNLINNIKKVYLVEETRNENEISINIKDAKVYFPRGVKGTYDAVTDTIIYEEENYSCRKEIETTSYGDRIIYTCDYKEVEE